VPRVEFACCRVRGDGDLTVAQLSRAALRLLSGPAACTGRQLVCLHGMGHPPPPRRGGGVCVPGSRHVVRFVPWSETEIARANEQLFMRGGDLSCEIETCCARRRLVGGGSSSGELVGEAPN
jgi:hypothetical protein